MAQLSPEVVHSQIAGILGDSVYHALGLKESLEDENRALSDRDMEALDEAVANKTRCVARLQSLEEQRKQVCKAAGFADDAGQMQQLTAWCDNDARLANSWAQLMAIATDCNDLNMRNGTIIRGLRHQIETGLAVIRGGSAEPRTYGQRGHEPGGPSQRTLAEA